MASALRHSVKTLALHLPDLAAPKLHPQICLRCLRAVQSKTVSSASMVTTQNPISKSRCLQNANSCQTGPSSQSRVSSARSKVTTLDPLQAEINTVTTIQDLFNAIGRHGTALDTQYVCLAIKKLHTILESQIGGDKSKEEVVKFINAHEEFRNLCQIALSKVDSMTNDELTDTLLTTRAYLQGGPSHPLARELYAEGSRRLNTLNSRQLAKLASFARFSFPKIPCVPLLGDITARFAEDFDNFDLSTMGDMVFLMTATNQTSTGDFQNRVLKKVTELLQKAVDGEKVVLSAKDIVNILSYEWKTYRDSNYPQLNRLCCDLLLDHVGLENVSTEDLHTICNLFLNLESADNEFFLNVNRELLTRLETSTRSSDIGYALEFLSIAAHYSRDASLKRIIEKKVDSLLDNEDAPLGSICISFRRMRYFSWSPVIKKLTAQITQAKELELEDIVHIMEYFKKTDLPLTDTGAMYAVLEKTLSDLQSVAISPLFLVNTFYCVSHLPKEIVRTTDLQLSMYEGILPQLNDRLINLLSFLLVRLKRKLDGEKADHVQNLLGKVNFLAISNIDQNKSISHLLNLSQFILEEGGGDIVFLDQAMKQYTEQVSKIRSPWIALKCTNILHRSGYLHVPLMDKIAEVLTKHMHHVNPSQVLGILQPYCNLGYHDPPNADEFFGACIDRVLPFIDTVETETKPNPFYLVMLATYLSYMQIFPEVLLKKIFSLEFLDKFDVGLKDLMLQGKRKLEAKNRRMLMNLNRSVVLECPNLQIPWFHEEHCHRLLQRRSQRLQGNEIELQSVLVEVLGGAQYLRSLVISPYYSDILFEFVLDSDGNPLPVAEYGSFLNFGIGSNRVISDLMQWGTQAKTLPNGAQRVAIDYMNPHCYNINSSSLLGGYIIKKRQLEILGYRHVQIPYYEWTSTSLPEKTDKVEYLQKLLFHKEESPLPAGPHTVLRDEHQDHQNGIGHLPDLSQRAVVLPGQKSIGGLDLRIREEDMSEDPMLMRVLRNLTKSTEGKHF